MRRASSKLLAHIRRPYPRTPLSLSTRDFAAASDRSSTSPPKSPRLKSCSASPSLLFSTQNPNRSVQLEEAFESAVSLDEKLAAFKVMETCFDEQDLGMACLKIAFKLDRDGDDPEKTLSFAQRALRIFDETEGNSVEKMSLPVGMTLYLLGSASFALSRFSESLGYLIRAKSVLINTLEGGSFYATAEFLPILLEVQFLSFYVQSAMGREEAIDELKVSLEIKEKALDLDGKELGNAYREAAEACLAVSNFEEALSFCLKAFEIHKAHLSLDSVAVAYDRRVLGVIYAGLEELDKALLQNQLSRKVLKKWGCTNKDLLRAEMDAANLQISLERYDEAINTLKGIVRQTEQDREDRAMIFTSMARALCSLEKFAQAKKCLEISCGILEKRERSSPLAVVGAYEEIAMQYEAMDDFKTALSLLKRTLDMLEKLPQEQHTVGGVSARIGLLILLTGKVEEAIPYLEDAAARLNESFGPKYFGIVSVYNNLGAAYMEVDRPQSAAQAFAYAKEIMDASLGPHHIDSIEACQNLSKAYAAMGSYPLAISFQEKAVEGWEGHGPSAVDELEKAVRVLDQLKEKASNSLNWNSAEGDSSSSYTRAMNSQNDVVESEEGKRQVQKTN